MRPTARVALLVLLAQGLLLVSRSARSDDGGLAPAPALGPTTPAPGPAPIAAPAPTAKPKPKPSASVKPLSPLASASVPVPAPSASVPAPSASAPDAASPEPAESAEPAPSSATAELAPPEALVAPVPSAVRPLPVASSEAAPPKPLAPGVGVRFGDEVVFAVRAPRAGRTAEERAAGATRMLARAAVGAKGSDVKLQRKGDVAIILVGQTPVIQLVAEDATAAGDTSLDVHAASVAASIRDAIDNERRRADIAHSVLSVSLLVFLGLVAFYLLQKVGDFAGRARTWIDEHGERVLAVRVRRIEVVSPGTLRSTAIVGLSVGKWIAQVAVVYLWVVYALSQFEATRGYTQRLTGLVLTPLYDLLARIAVGLPVLVVLVIAGFAVFVLVRFVGLFFSSVGRRENVVPWIPPDLVPPVSSLVRFGIIVAALLFIAPLITGSSESVLARSGWVVMLALGLAATPLLANGLAGTVVLFGRKLRAGQYVRIGDAHGRIAIIGLLELSLEDDDGVEIRIPHLFTLFRPMRVSNVKISDVRSRDS